MVHVMTAILLVAAAAEEAGPGFTAGPVEQVASGFQFTEGPVWVSGEGLLFSDIPADTVYRSEKSVFRQPSGKSNGLTLDPEGRLIACEHGARRVSRSEPGGQPAILADRYLGRRLNSPNDAAVRSDGTVFFTDPPYGLEDREAELPFSGVYAVTPAGEVRLLSVYFKRPNGLAFSPDEKTLYIADSEEGFIQAFAVEPDGRLTHSRLFCEVPTPDGMKVDVRGNVWTTAADGVRVYSPAGKLLETIAFPEQPANCAFGGDDYKTLYVTARQGLYRVRTTVPGIAPGRR